MGQVSASSSITIDAPPERVLTALADYQNFRPRILSDHYTEYRVLEGGQGDGTVAEWRLQATEKRVRDIHANVAVAGSTITERDRTRRWSRPMRSPRAAAARRSPPPPNGPAPAASRASSRRRSPRSGCARSRRRCSRTCSANWPELPSSPITTIGSRRVGGLFFSDRTAVSPTRPWRRRVLVADGGGVGAEGCVRRREVGHPPGCAPPETRRVRSSRRKRRDDAAEGALSASGAGDVRSVHGVPDRPVSARV